MLRSHFAYCSRENPYFSKVMSQVFFFLFFLTKTLLYPFITCYIYFAVILNWLYPAISHRKCALYKILLCSGKNRFLSINLSCLSPNSSRFDRRAVFSTWTFFSFGMSSWDSFSQKFVEPRFHARWLKEIK